MAARKDGKVKVTARGITVAVDPDMMDDIDMVDDFAAVQDGDVFAIPRLLRRLFGDDYRRVKGELAGPGGVTRATDFIEFMGEVMRSVSALEAKN